MFGLPTWIVFGCFVCQLALGYGYVFGPLLKDITADLDITRAAFGSARVASTVTVACASPVLGWLVVRAGARAVLLSSVLLIVVTYVWLARAQSLADLYVGYAMVGLLTAGLGDITVGAVVAQWVTRYRGLALGAVYTGSNVGAIIFVQVATWLAVHQSWRTALLSIGLGGAAVLLPFAGLVVRDRRAGDVFPDPELEAGAAPSLDASFLTSREALRTRSFWILWASLFAFFFYFLAILDLFVAFLTDAGVDREAASGYFSFAIAMGLLSKIAMGAFADRMPARTAFIVNYGLLTASSLILLLLPGQGFLQVYVVVFGFSYAARDVVCPIAIVECFGVRHLAPIYGLLMLVLLPASFGPAFAHWTFDTHGSYELAFQVFAAMNLLVFASLFLLRRERP